ncbi:hypothetical protein B5K08_21815 [Rhizobium leguminosarum bv. trifolii]|uniref:Uncharacterized protein n=1 Tax=Rhizobium leguminosarum bv. trifolii TaxID=386 RepID=A0A3E1BAY2_RHILT|nr:hypothetical protein [Rhizobium leguminosarum]RFB87918.1 hypothetical protein B5K08_21815 [Rhizobium leguminosarum bv. trifolii]RFB88159.1 hypothetical protein B5K10_21810 [Rhizobium leguminosarum bv. trifolii]
MDKKTAKLNNSRQVESKADFAARIGVTPGRISQLIRQGLPLDGARVNVSAALDWVAANVDRPSNAGAEGDGGLVAARIRAANALARSREFDLKAKAGLYMDRMEAIAWIRGQRAIVEGRLSALPATYAPFIAERLGVDPEHCQAALSEIVAALFDDLGDTVPPASLRELLQLAVKFTHGDDYATVEDDMPAARNA